MSIERKRSTIKRNTSVLIFGLIGLMQAYYGEAQNRLLDQNSSLTALTKLAKCGKWESVKQDNGVDISYRWLAFGDTLKTREVATCFIADARVEDVLINLRTKQALETWNNGVRELNLLKNTDSSWITHTIYNIPYPFSQQDLVLKNTIERSADLTLVHVKALPEYIALVDDVNRQRYYRGQWTLKPLVGGKTEVHFSVISFSKSSIPRFIRDPIIQHALLSSFIKLKALSTKSARMAVL